MDLINWSFNSKHITECGNEGDSYRNSEGLWSRPEDSSIFSFFTLHAMMAGGCWGCWFCAAGCLGSDLPRVSTSNLGLRVGKFAEGRIARQEKQAKLNRTKHKTVSSLVNRAVSKESHQRTACWIACCRWPCFGRGLDWMTHRGPFQPLPFWDSVTGAFHRCSR